jgi:hypothetical protein
LIFLAGTPIKRLSPPLYHRYQHSLIGFLGDVKLRHRLGIFTLLYRSVHCWNIFLDVAQSLYRWQN